MRNKKSKIPSAGGLSRFAEKALCSLPSSDGTTNSFVSDQSSLAAMASHTPSDTNEPQSSVGDLFSSAEKAFTSVSPSDGTIDAIRDWHRERRFAMDQRKRLDLALGAYVRTSLGWRKSLPEAERKAIATQAAVLLKNPDGSKLEAVIKAQFAGREPFEHIESMALKNMEKLAKTLPAWGEFAKGVRGFGAGSLAVIIAETGDLSNYSSIAKVWKRMGLAVMGDVRQGGLPKGSGAEAWIAHGYSPMRRSLAWNIGDAMIKAQVRKVKDAEGEDTGGRVALGPYGEAYLARKAYELLKEPDMQPIKAHRRAQRYMEKRLLKHLWQAWRRACSGVAETPVRLLPDAPLQIAA